MILFRPLTPYYFRKRNLYPMHLAIVLLLLLQNSSASQSAVQSTPIPEHLTIEGAQWKVTMTDWDPRGVAGLTSHDSHTIYIARKQSLSSEQDTVLHELLHCIMGHKFTDEKIRGHEAISTLTPKLLKLFQDNPELVKYLQQDETTTTAKHSAD